MYPHTLTAWRPEKDGRSTEWTPLGTITCRWDSELTVQAGTDGSTAQWVTSILVPSASTDAPLRRGDRVMLGGHDCAEPPDGSMTVTRCDPVSVGSAAPDHWEAEAR